MISIGIFQKIPPQISLEISSIMPAGLPTGIPHVVPPEIFHRFCQGYTKEFFQEFIKKCSLKILDAFTPIILDEIHPSIPAVASLWIGDIR